MMGLRANPRPRQHHQVGRSSGGTRGCYGGVGGKFARPFHVTSGGAKRTSRILRTELQLPCERECCVQAAHGHASLRNESAVDHYGGGGGMLSWRPRSTTATPRVAPAATRHGTYTVLARLPEETDQRDRGELSEAIPEQPGTPR